ncbi:PP2C family protein-serine/threonine phosphatase [Pararhodonellum marinum]|uniref:PP2C family protein-serine/threonine phosphatase n=1 Tax=Pararhodonellum marinum TaxID=2755358 RepID=UPI00188FEECA|nr:protein phosphatase 2C domain-containing protein [Pararhodonellum marinum]
MTHQISQKYSFQIESFSELGKKANNEDSILVCELESGIHLFIVCDGLGGHPAGEVASKITCDTIKDYFSQGNLEAVKSVDILQCLEKVKERLALYEKACPDTLGMKTTMAGVIADRFGLKIVWIGDSRVYHIRDGEILFQTLDHSYGNYLVRKMGLSQKEAMRHPKKHKITRVLSAERDINPEIEKVTTIKEGDYFLICSDGLLERIDCSFIRSSFKIRSGVKDLSARIQNTCQNKTNDNYSMVLIQVILN